MDRQAGGDGKRTVLQGGITITKLNFLLKKHSCLYGSTVRRPPCLPADYHSNGSWGPVIERRGTGRRPIVPEKKRGCSITQTGGGRDHD